MEKDNCNCKDCDCEKEEKNKKCECESDNCKQNINDKCECDCTEGKRDPNCKCEGECHCNDDKKYKKNKEKNKHKEEVIKLNNEIKKLKEEVLVAKADSINYRKRKDEEVARLLKYCNEDLIKQFLSVLDNFERAIKLDDDNLEDEVSKFLEGFKMIYCNMQNILSSYEVKPIDKSNVEFDPSYHNAIMTEKREGIESGMVLEVLQKGYIYKEKVIRPAMVKVSE